MTPEIKILIIYNNRTNYKHYKTILQRPGVNISGMADPEAAINFFETNVKIQEPFDLVLLDYFFQHTNGFQVAEKLYKMYPDVLCMLLPSSMIYEDDMNEQFNEFILEPDVSSKGLNKLIDFVRQKKLKKQQEMKNAD